MSFQSQRATKIQFFPQFLELLLILKIIVQSQQALQKDVSVELSIFVKLSRKVVEVVSDTSRSVKSYCGDELKEACGAPRGVTLRSLLTGFREDFSNKNKVSSSNF